MLLPTGPCLHACGLSLCQGPGQQWANPGVAGLPRGPWPPTQRCSSSFISLFLRAIGIGLGVDTKGVMEPASFPRGLPVRGSEVYKRCTNSPHDPVER